jgi:ribosomal-protein-alanine N-acetyltransferase
MVTLETERLMLREWLLDDLNDMCVMTSDAEVMRYITNGKTRDREQTKASIERQMKQAADLGYCMWAVDEKSTGRLIGINGIQPLEKAGEVEIGWWLVRDKWGQGFATEGARAGMTFAFEELNLPRLVAIADPDNVASTNIMVKLGMTFQRMATLKSLTGRAPDFGDFEVAYYVRENPSGEGEA